ncbi:MAG: response regulator [Nitrososphaeraceae archaeon]
MIYHSSKDFRFIQSSKKCCVGFIDLVNSTSDILPIISQVKLESYYSIFINSLTKIIRGYDGEIVKNIGDCLLFYFPKTSKSESENEFKKVIECFFEVLDTRLTINNHLTKENLPNFSYKITIDYGILNFALTGSYNQVDIFGSIVNICSKLNCLSIPNRVTIGENFYKLLTSFPTFFDRYDFSLVGEHVISEHNKYLLYNITRTKNNYMNQPYYSASLNHTSTSRTINNNYRGDKLRLTANKSNGKKIIIIDDDEDVVITLKYILENNKYDVTSFTNSLKALKFLKESLYLFDNNLLIILDIRMRNLNGIQFYKQIKSLDSSIKFLFITGLDIIEELKSIIPGLTSNQIKKKPIEEGVLINTVKQLLN